MSTTSPSRMHHLDAMRGVAALAVCVQHFADFWMHAAAHAYSPLLSALFLEGMNLGRFGVVLFFLLTHRAIFSVLLQSCKSLVSISVKRCANVAMLTQAASSR